MTDEQRRIDKGDHIAEVVMLDVDSADEQQEGYKRQRTTIMYHSCKNIMYARCRKKKPREAEQVYELHELTVQEATTIV